LLRRDVQRDRPQVDLHHPVDDRDQEEEARAFGLREQPPEAEDDAALVLPRHLDRRDQEEQQQEDDDGEDDECSSHGSWILRPSATARKPPRGTGVVTTTGRDVWYGEGALRKSMIEPIARQISPATLIAPWLVTCTSMMSKVIPSRSSASPPQLIGSTENPKSAVMRETAPSAPGSTTPGWKISKPIPASPA